VPAANWGSTDCRLLEAMLGKWVVHFEMSVCRDVVHQDSMLILRSCTSALGSNKACVGDG
jgi:hypothetical protein